MRRLLSILFLSAGLLAGARATSLPPAVEQALVESGVDPSQVGAVVMPLDGAEPLVAFNAQQSMNPASTMKLLTTYAALSVLGPDYRWRTRVHARGRREGDVLHGHLVLEGGGDPKLVIEDLAELIARLRRTGLREIRGDLIVDDGLYEVGPHSVEAFDDTPSAPYNVRPHAAMMNFKSTRVLARADARGVDVALDPPLDDVVIVNDIRRVQGPCRGNKAVLAVGDAGDEARPAIRVTGTLAASCGTVDTFASVLTHRQFIHGLFKSAWRASGGTWNGGTRIERGGAGGRLVLEWISPRPLSEIVRDINKFSNNVMARQVLLQLAAERGSRPATAEGARAMLLGWLGAQDLLAPDIVVDNGSGLSRDERIAPASLARLLVHAGNGPLRTEFLESLPVVGVDGTMRKRLLSDEVAGRAWIKTGSLADVRAVAGYVRAASDRMYAVVMLVNGPRAGASRSAQDALLRWVHANG